MNEYQQGTNYIHAKESADKVDEAIIRTLESGKNFRVEAGAGAGKTYSLNKVIEWIQANKEADYKVNHQYVICITYTNAAVEVIKERIVSNSFIVPSTIHSFAWEAIKQYQTALIGYIENDETLQAREGDFSRITEVMYDQGHRYKKQGIHHLYHNDVLELFCLLLKNKKFRRLFSSKYPLILIDEYQDTYKPIIDCFLEYFINDNNGPQFGFFGDAWQTIYQSSKACGQVVHNNIKEIKKGSNFRSAPRIVQLLNDIRPELPQESAIDGFEGKVVVVTCDDYTGPRRTERNFKDDLPEDELKQRLEEVKSVIKSSASSNESFKVLMITHKVLAAQQGYKRLLEILEDGFRDIQDPFLMFFMNTVEPVYEALKDSNMQLLFDTLGIKRYPITKKSDKRKWKQLEQLLTTAREKKAIDVLNVVIDSSLIPIPPHIEGYLVLYQDAPNTIYGANASIFDYLELEYNQFISAIHFLYPEAEFSTEHGVKGEEYDNVVFVIGRGWNQYQFERYVPIMTGHAPMNKEKQSSFERNRNLFYVCCSRARKRLILLITIPIDDVFRMSLISLFGEENIIPYNQFVRKYI